MYQQGDDQAFEALYSRHSARVYGYLSGRIGDRSRVDDAFQMVFMKLHRTRRRYDPGFPFAPWLFTICRSSLMQYFRDSLRHPERPIPESELIAFAGAAEGGLLSSSEAGPEAPGLGELPPAQRKAVELRYLDELSFKEIASRLEKSESNVRQLVSRGIRKLRVGLGRKGRAGQ